MAGAVLTPWTKTSNPILERMLFRRERKCSLGELKNKLRNRVGKE